MITSPSHLIEPFPLRTLESIDRFLRNAPHDKEFIGTTNSACLAQILGQRLMAKSTTHPVLVIVPSLKEAELFQDDLQFFDPTIQSHVLPVFDVSPYSQLYPNRRTVADRLYWLHRAQHAGAAEIFIAPITALLQRTLPFDVLAKNQFSLKPGEAIPEPLSRKLEALGYQATPLVEDVGTFSIRGSVVDIYSPAHKNPVRLELFGDTIETVKEFDAASQRSLQTLPRAEIIAAHEVLWTDETSELASRFLREDLSSREIDPEEARTVLSSVARGQYFFGVEFLLAAFYPRPAEPLDHFSSPLEVWWVDAIESFRVADEFRAANRREFDDSPKALLRPRPDDLFVDVERLSFPPDSQQIRASKIQIGDKTEGLYNVKVSDLIEFANQTQALNTKPAELQDFVSDRLKSYRSQGQAVFVACGNLSQGQRLYAFLERCGFHVSLTAEETFAWSQWVDEQRSDLQRIHIVPNYLSDSFRWTDEDIVFLRDEDFFGRKRARREYKKSGSLETRVGSSLSFGDLKVGDFVVHKTHGIGLYEGLKVMPIGGVDAEFIQLSYKDKDRLYLPVYRVGQIQKYSGPTAPHLLDRLGGQGWEKTKTKVRSHLRDVASDLLNLYALRSQMQRPAFPMKNDDDLAFESAFPYEETPDQSRAISEILKDMHSDKPMDRLICGDVGFGKTEIAMRAIFKAVTSGRQVGVIAPTTVLTFQHLETFQKRFQKWPIKIRGLNRFVAKKDQTETLREVKSGQVDILVGTHRLLSKDVQFKDLGLLVIDEEQKFGVRHKERLRQMKASVDTLAMSATPIPRTLNMSLMGLRDLSIINTAPVDRLPTRTFVCKFDKDTIRKAVTNEVARGGQVYFIHNRIQSIYGLADELRELLPDVKMRVAHGQMDEGQLEETMLAFFHHEIDMLLCTAIVESGMDVSSANTMFIDNAQQFGLSQLYQLRGRVGRSKERAYCYLLIPPHGRIDVDAQERLKVLQENTALGSGIRIAHYDLELRGAGDLLGEEQSGHIQAVGYELYLELLDEAVRTLKGEPERADDVDPEINVRIPALIPDFYIPDIRMRLSYYKALSEIEGPDDLERIEDELRDQFGKPPEPVMNLMGLMLIRKVCKSLSVRDLSSGKALISLSFTENTRLPAATVIELASRSNKKYTVTPEHRLNIRMNEITWPRIYDELVYLEGLC